jgi:magnesium-transporting ATPase (P-type)
VAARAGPDHAAVRCPSPLSTSPSPSVAGLSSADAADRLRRDGPNELPAHHRPAALRRFAGQLIHFFALMLWVASGLALLAGLPQLTVAIAVVIILNAVFAFVQQDRADRAAERLHALLPRRVTVRRDGLPVAIEAAEVVVGDRLLLEAGDRVPADARVVATHGLVLDTSLLTGESVTTTVEAGGPLYAGTFVVEGDCEADVTATGGSTRLAGIARLTTLTPPPPSPLGGRRRP